jgi:hypothetical protein
MPQRFLLSGLDGANPLGFLAAVGLTRVLAGSRIGWEIAEAVWRPVLWTDAESEEALCERVAQATRQEPPAIAILGKNLTVSLDVFQAFAREAERLWSEGDGRAAELAAAFGSEVCCDAKKNRMEYTSLSFITGSGHQDFVPTAGRLSAEVGPRHIREALFGPWRYEDKSLSFRWDPSDAAEYALSAGDPSKEGSWTVWGANRLAFEALPLLPAMPTARGLRTTGFRKVRQREEFTWPLWDSALEADTIRTLLSYRGLQEDLPAREELIAMGVLEVFRAPRVRIGAGANFKVSFRPPRTV